MTFKSYKMTEKYHWSKTSAKKHNDYVGLPRSMSALRIEQSRQFPRYQRAHFNLHRAEDLKDEDMQMVVWDRPPMKIANLWMPEVSTRGNMKCPKGYPRFSAKSFMFVVWTTPRLMAELYEMMRQKQQEFWEPISCFQGSVIQGEHDAEGKKHLQGCVNFSDTIRSTALWNIFKEYLTTIFGLQVTTTKGPRLTAWHYCTKPHNKCACSHCQKARGCEPNWTLPLVCGIVPLGQGNKFGQFIAAMKENPNKQNMVENFGMLYVRYPNGMDAIRRHYQFKEKAKKFRCTHLYLLSNLQIALCIQVVYCGEPTSTRNIAWIWSKKLNTGKSLMACFMKALKGLENVMDGMKSMKHIVNCYENETFMHFNFTKHEIPTKDDLVLLESLDDGGFKQAPMYGSRKDIINIQVVVTANVPPPDVWVATGEARVSTVICLDPPEGYERPKVWYNERRFGGNDTPNQLTFTNDSKVVLRPTYNNLLAARNPFSNTRFA